VLVAVACCLDSALAAENSNPPLQGATAIAAATSPVATIQKRRAPRAGKRPAAQPPDNPPSTGLAHTVKRGEGPLDRLLGTAPPSQALAQVEKDLAVSGTRSRESRGLYEGGLDTQLQKVQKNDADSAPSFSISRSSAIDVFTGRPQSARTEVKFGLTF
jgi:hypothetical protein